MRRLSAIFICGVVAFCGLANAKEDNFARLRDRVKKGLPDHAFCGVVSHNEMAGGRYFEISAPGSGFRVVVTEKAYLSVKEWTRRYERDRKRLEKLGKPGYSAEDMTEMATLAMRLLDLPGYRYGDIGVSVDMQIPDEVSPTMEKDSRAAERWLRVVTGLLKEYPVVPRMPA